MAIYLNLYHETQRQKLKRQRDPFKLAIVGALVVVIGFIGYYFWRSEAVSRVKRESQGVEADWNKLEPKQKAAKDRVAELTQNINLADALNHKVENRFYWAPMLQQLIQIVPPDIQITGMDGAVSLDGSKKVSISLRGMATGAQPRSVAEDLRTTLQNKLGSKYKDVTSVFGTLEDGAETVQYEGKALPTALFTINLSFVSPDVDETTAKPAPRRTK
jgi:hypothetical protein